MQGCKVWSDGTKSFHFTASNLPQSTKKKIKSPLQLHSLTSLQNSNHSFHSLSLSLYPLALATTATTSNQTKSFTFLSLALIRSAPRLHSFKLFTSLSLFLSTRWQQQLVGYFKVQIKLRFSLSHVSSSGHES